MKKNYNKIILALALVAGAQMQLRAQGTAFTYQGRLNFNGSPAAGVYDFRFRVATDVNGNNFAASAFLTNGVPVTNGLFLAALDFGAGVFNGPNYWLQIEVKTNGAAGYTTLYPLQAMAPTPYAIFANTASNVSGTVSAAQIAGGTILNSVLPVSPNFSGVVAANSFSGNGANVTNVNAASLNGLSSSNFWQAGGNNVANGQFLGSTNNQPVEIRVNGGRALQLVPTVNDANHSNLVNLVAGSSGNYIAAGVYGSVIAGGGASYYFGPGGTNAVFADVSFIGGGYANSIRASAFGGVIGGGFGNLIQASAGYSFIGSGQYNSIRQAAYDSVINGGYNNDIGTNAYISTIGGGEQNVIFSGAAHATIGGGAQNIASGVDSTIPGGLLNTAQADYSFAAGYYAQAMHQGSFVWADSQGTPFSSTANDQFSVRAQGGVLLNAGTNCVEIASGGIKVTGAGVGASTPVFVHRATAANIESGSTHRTTINNPYCNGDPNAILIVTHSYNPGGVSPSSSQTHPFGVFYNTTLAKWQIFNEDFTAFTANTAFNVMIVKP
jgi:hypothetical protein